MNKKLKILVVSFIIVILFNVSTYADEHFPVMKLIKVEVSNVVPDSLK